MIWNNSWGEIQNYKALYLEGFNWQIEKPMNFYNVLFAKSGFHLIKYQTKCYAYIYVNKYIQKYANLDPH